MNAKIRPAVVAAIAVALLPVACKKETPIALAESASVLSAAVPPPSAKVVAYKIDVASKTSIDMPGVAEHIKADTDVAAGKLDVDVTNLANTRGEVKVDLTSLKTHTFGNDKDASQTAHALNWLEVGDAAASDVKKANQYAVFAIQSIDKLSESNVSKVQSTKDGNEDIRTITGAAHGEFLVHGHKAMKDVPIEARFHYPSGAPADSNPTRVDIKSKEPLHVTLKEHDVHPRDSLGNLAQWTSSLVSKVAETADITLDVHADLVNK